MDRDRNPSSTPKRTRFAPKAPPRRKPKPLINPKTELEDNNDDEAAEALLQRVNKHLGKRGPRAEKKSPVQVAFANTVASSGLIRSFGVPRQGNGTTNSSGSNSETFADDGKIICYSPSNAIQDVIGGPVNVVETSDKKKKDYKEPWDYSHSSYPITLPLRPPYSGDPELLDEKEFGEAAMDLEYDENTVNHASELGLLEENDKPEMLFLQFPPTLPLETLQEKRLATPPVKDKGKEKVGASRSPLGAGERGTEKRTELRPPRMGFGLNKGRNLENLPKGCLGKLLVYKSGAIKWKIGEVIYDVAAGVGCNFAQDVVAMNTAEKHACILREVGKRAVVTPNIDSLLDSNLDLGPS